MANLVKLSVPCAVLSDDYGCGCGPGQEPTVVHFLMDHDLLPPHIMHWIVWFSAFDLFTDNNPKLVLPLRSLHSLHNGANKPSFLIINELWDIVCTESFLLDGTITDPEEDPIMAYLHAYEEEALADFPSHHPPYVSVLRHFLGRLLVSHVLLALYSGAFDVFRNRMSERDTFVHLLPKYGKSNGTTNTNEETEGNDPPIPFDVCIVHQVQ